jgi:hypothetical protein
MVVMCAHVTTMVRVVQTRPCAVSHSVRTKALSGNVFDFVNVSHSKGPVEADVLLYLAKKSRP